MKISFITPEGSLEDFVPMSDLHLIIANFVEKKAKYTKFFKEREEYVIMDNGLFEVHTAMPAHELLKRAEMVNADEVVAPDVLFDGKETVESAKKFIMSAMDMEIDMESPFYQPKFHKKFKIMAVPQGKTPQEWVRCYEQLADMNEIDVIGLSCLSIPKAFSKISGVKTIMENRLLAIQMLIDEGLIFKDVEYHLLGCGNPLELMYQKQHNWIRSCDTSSPIVHGINDVLYDPYRGLMQPKIQTKLDFKSTIPKTKYKNIYYNMTILKKLASV